MKKVLIIVVVALLTAAGAMSFSGCKKIDGARFTATKAILSATVVSGGDTEEKDDDTYTVSYSLTISVAVSEVDSVLTLEKSRFVFSHEAVSIKMTDLSGTSKETIEAVGPKSEKNESGQFVTWVKFEMNFGTKTNAELLALRSDLKLEYKGVNIPMPKVVSYK